MINNLTSFPANAYYIQYFTKNVKCKGANSYLISMHAPLFIKCSLRIFQLNIKSIEIIC